jgi:tungstate transport system substrate-binding protein
MFSRRIRRLVPLVLLLALCGLGSAASATADSPTVVLVQGGTTISDSGLMDHIIAPGFQAAYPQYQLQFVPVGTSQALINAENGEADAVFTHNPTAEAAFVAGGYSYEPLGRAVMYSDFVVVGPTADPAGVHTAGPANAVKAFEAIAAAGNARKADFVSRGDGSGTNLKELQIWALTNVPLNTLGEPGTPGTTTDAPWYHKAGEGQAQTLQVADQCPFSSHNCYAIADRGTFNYLISTGAITHLKIVSQHNPAPAAGGPGLMNNLYHAYAVKPGSTSRTINIAGAVAFLDYLTSHQFQAAVAKYPTAAKPAFHPDAYPQIIFAGTFPHTFSHTKTLTVKGKIKSVVPFSAPLAGAPVQVFRAGSTTPVVSGTLSSTGTYSLSWQPTVSDTYRIVFPQFQDLRATQKKLGALTVT